MKRTKESLSIRLGWALLLALVLALPGLSANGKDEKQSSGAAAVSDPDRPYLASVEHLTLTAHIHWNNIYALKDSWTVINKASEYTNVSLKGTASTAEGDSRQAFNLMIASRNIPDIVGGKRDDINKYGTEGAFVPLNGLIKEYAPHINSYLESNPDVRAALTAEDGNIYQIPTIYTSLISEAWFLRQDWMDKLGLKTPQTVGELHDVLKAFIECDPNGNGIKDEVGYFTRLGGADANQLTGLLSLFGVSEYWHTNKKGMVEMGLYTSQFKDAMKNISLWYREGLIDKEIFTRGTQARDMLFPENNGGVIHDWIPSTTGYNSKMADKVPGFKIAGILPPKDINGNVWEVAAREKMGGSGWAISASNEHQIETMRYMDFWWTEEGVRLSTYGIEGDTYTLVDGKPVYTEKVLGSSSPINHYMRTIGGQIEDIGYPHDASYERFMMDGEGVRVTKLYSDAGVVNKLNVKLPALSLTEEELNVITSKYPSCRTYMLEQMIKWTFDASRIDSEFGQYMNTLKSMGMDEVVAAYQTAYERMK